MSNLQPTVTVVAALCYACHSLSLPCYKLVPRPRKGKYKINKRISSNLESLVNAPVLTHYKLDFGIVHVKNNARNA